MCNGKRKRVECGKPEQNWVRVSINKKLRPKISSPEEGKKNTLDWERILWTYVNVHLID